MAKDFNKKRPYGSKNNEPRPLCELFREYLQSDEPVASTLRTQIIRRMKEEQGCEPGQTVQFCFPNTELDVDLKLLTLTPGRMSLNTPLEGSLTRDSEYHYTFEEMPSRSRPKRNPITFEGRYVNLSVDAYGTPHPHFKSVPRDWRDHYGKYILAVCDELSMAFYSLVER